MGSTTGTTVRAATERDIGVIAAIWQAGWVDGHAGHVPPTLERQRRSGDWAGEARRRLDTTSVAETNERRVVGFVTVIDDEIEQVYIDAAARGTGVAEQLLRHGEHIARTAGHRRAWLAVAAGNQRARRFYERCGWTDSCEFIYTAHVAGNKMPVPAHRYSKDLAPPVDAAPSELPTDVVAHVRACATLLSGLVEEPAWTGIRWRVGTATVAHLVWIHNGWPPAYARAAGTDGPQAVLTVSADPDERAALTATDPRFFRPVWATRWRHPVLGIRLDEGTGWEQITELIATSFRLAAPQQTTPTKEPRT